MNDVDISALSLDKAHFKSLFSEDMIFLSNKDGSLCPNYQIWGVNKVGIKSVTIV